MGDLKREIGKQQDLEPDNVRLFKNKKDFIHTDAVLLTDVIKPGDLIKAVPKSSRGGLDKGFYDQLEYQRGMEKLTLEKEEAERKGEAEKKL